MKKKLNFVFSVLSVRVVFLSVIFHSVVFVSEASATCIAPWGMPIGEGQFVVAFYEDRATGGRRCQSEMRFCNNGFLSGFYRYQNCTEDLGCNEFPWGYIPNLSSVTAYRNSIESGGRQCESEVRYCSYGRLSGRFTNQSCTAF